MGNSVRSQYPQYQLLRSGDDKRFGEVSIWSKGRQLVLQKNIVFDSDDERHDYVNQCLAAKNRQQESLLQIYHCEPDYMDVNLYLEFYESDLSKEVIQRGMEQVPFTNEEVIFLIEKMIAVGAYLKQQGIYHGDLKSANILLDDCGVPKIADYGLVHPFKQGPIKTLHIRDKTYMSPELMDSIRCKESRPNIDYYKNDIFVLGMTLLEMTTLTNLHCCYNWTAVAINMTILNEFINQMAETYTPLIQGLIRQMLNFNPLLRPDYDQLQRQIEQREVQQLLPQPQPRYAAPAQPQSSRYNVFHDITNSQMFARQPSRDKVIRKPSVAQLTNHTNFTLNRPPLRNPSPLNSARSSVPMKRSISVNSSTAFTRPLPVISHSPMRQMPISPAYTQQSPIKMIGPPDLTFNPLGSIYVSFGEMNRKQRLSYHAHPVPVAPTQYLQRAPEVSIRDTHVSAVTKQQSNQQSNYASKQKSQDPEDLDERVNKAIQMTQQTIKRSSQQLPSRTETQYYYD